jgi:hypothetical protein
MTTREIQGHLQEIYGIEVSPTLISNSVWQLDLAHPWSSHLAHPLEP